MHCRKAGIGNPNEFGRPDADAERADIRGRNASIKQRDLDRAQRVVAAVSADRECLPVIEVVIQARSERPVDCPKLLTSTSAWAVAGSARAPESASSAAAASARAERTRPRRAPHMGARDPPAGRRRMHIHKEKVRSRRPGGAAGGQAAMAGRPAPAPAARSYLGARRSALGARRSALGARRSALGARRSALGARRSALGARRSALGARRSALGALNYTVTSPQQPSKSQAHCYAPPKSRPVTPAAAMATPPVENAASLMIFKPLSGHVFIVNSIILLRQRTSLTLPCAVSSGRNPCPGPGRSAPRSSADEPLGVAAGPRPAPPRPRRACCPTSRGDGPDRLHLTVSRARLLARAARSHRWAPRRTRRARTLLLCGSWWSLPLRRCWRLPGIGDRERRAQPLVEFGGRLAAVPSAPGERSGFVFRVGRDHHAQPGLGVLDGPVCSPRSRRRHGAPPVSHTLIATPIAITAVPAMTSLRALACSAVPVLTVSSLHSWGLPPSCRFLLRLSVPPRPPDHSLQAQAFAPRPLCRRCSIDCVPQEAVARAGRREPWRGVWRGDFVPASRRRRPRRLSGAARSDFGGYRVKGDVSRIGASSFLMQAPLRAFPGYRAFMRASRPIVARCGPRGVRDLAPPSSAGTRARAPRA